MRSCPLWEISLSKELEGRHNTHHTARAKSQSQPITEGLPLLQGLLLDDFAPGRGGCAETADPHPGLGHFAEP